MISAWILVSIIVLFLAAITISAVLSTRAAERQVAGLQGIISRVEEMNAALTETALRAHNIPFISSKRETIPSDGWWDRKPKPVVVKPTEKEVS